MSVLQSELLRDPTSGTPARPPWRLVAAATALSSAVAHIPILQDHLQEAPYIGVGFLLLVCDTPAAWTSALVVSVAALLAFVASRTFGLPLIGDDVGSWADPLGIVALVSEAVVLVTSLLSLGAGRTAAR